MSNLAMLQEGLTEVRQKLNRNNGLWSAYVKSVCIYNESHR